MLRDWPVERLQTYHGAVPEPADFDDFWADTLAESRQLAAPCLLSPVATGLASQDVFDLEFSGFNGERVRGWLRVPRALSGPAPAIVEYIGYGGGRGHALEHLLWADLGYVHLVMDSRGQGSGWSLGVTPDSAAAGPQVPGMMTRGIEQPSTYYYRRLMTDAVLAIDAVRAQRQVDPDRVAVMGGSQGGALALAAAALAPGLAAVQARVPFLCDFRRAVDATDARPFDEITQYLAVHRDQSDAVFETLAYFDGVNFARRSQVPLAMTVALGDEIVPPSTVYAAFNNYAGPKELTVWPHNGHESGGVFDDEAAARFFAERLQLAQG